MKIYARLIVLMCILLIPSITFSATYYVKNGGNNALDGLSDENAWETIAKINGINFANDDIIQLKRGSTFTDATLTLDSSSVGRSGIIVQDYSTGNKPRIDGNSVQPIVINHALIDLTLKNIDISGSDTSGNRCHINYVNGLVIDGVDYNGHTGSSTYYRSNCLNIGDVDGDIEIKNCEIQNLLKDTWANTVISWGSLDAHAIIFWYVTGAKILGTINIHDNNIHDIYADCIQTACVQTTCNIYDNQLHNFGENAVDHKKGRHINIYRNDITSGGKTGNASSSCIGGGAGTDYCTEYDAEDITVYDNYIYDTPTYGISVGVTGMNNYKIYRNYFKDVGLCIVVSVSSNTEIYNNIFEITEPADSSFLYTKLSGIRVMYNAISDLKIYNNSFYITSSNHLYGIAIQADADATGTVVKNNIVHMTRNDSVVYPLYIEDYDNAENLPTVQYNNLYGTHSNRVRIEETPGNWSTYDSTEQADWIAAGHTGALFADPMFTNPGGNDLTLQSASPAIDVGVDLGVGYDDALDPDSVWPDGVLTLDQDLYGDGWEIGAYVFEGGLPTTAIIGYHKNGVVGTYHKNGIAIK